jgi:hypothetical protein
LIEAFIQFVSQYDPSFPARIEGASNEEIDLLTGLVGRSLPASYREYLAAMGHLDGNLDLAFDGSTKISDVIDYYQEAAQGQVHPPPLGCIVVGTGDPAVGEVYLEEVPDTKEPRMMLGVDGKIGQTYGESLPKVLYRKAFIKHELARTPFSAFYIDRKVRDLVSLASGAAVEEGFEPLWFSDLVAFCAQRDEVILMVEWYPKTLGLLKLAAGRREEVEEIGSLFSERLGLQFRQWWHGG